MRNLTIRRNKAYAGCLMALKVYIEDPTSSELTISGTPCRKLGTLKNGEEKTFPVGNEAAKVYVICDNLSKEYCNDMFQLSEGEEDISLSGRCFLNPAAGNAFIFDGNNSEQAMKNRKKGTKIGIIVLVVLFVVGLCIGFGISYFTNLEKNANPETFEAEGLKITLTDRFTVLKDTGYTVSYESDHAVMFALKESFTLAEGLEDYTVAQYGDLVFEANNLTDAQLKTENGLTYFTYDAKVQNVDYSYVSFLYKSQDAFWMVQFATQKSEAEQYRADIFAWAKTVSFS